MRFPFLLFARLFDMFALKPARDGEVPRSRHRTILGVFDVDHGWNVRLGYRDPRRTWIQ